MRTGFHLPQFFKPSRRIPGASTLSRHRFQLPPVTTRQYQPIPAYQPPRHTRLKAISVSILLFTCLAGSSVYALWGQLEMISVILYIGALMSIIPGMLTSALLDHQATLSYRRILHKIDSDTLRFWSNHPATDWDTVDQLRIELHCRPTRRDSGRRPQLDLHL